MNGSAGCAVGLAVLIVLPRNSQDMDVLLCIAVEGSLKSWLVELSLSFT